MAKKVGIVGIGVGDEGKAKVAVYFVSSAVKNLSSQNEILPEEKGKPIAIERYQGGSNAGHTIEIGGVQYKLNNIPCGILYEHTYNLMGQKTFPNPREVVAEIERLRKRGINISESNFGIAANAHVTLDYHVLEDQIIFKSTKRTSTGSGIKQTAVDKQGRVGMRFIEFLDPQLMKEALQARFPQGLAPPFGSFDEFVASYGSERDFLKGFAVQEHITRKIHGSQFWIGEGAQGALLDVDSGLYPGITSSNPLDVPNRPDAVVGVLKLYTSSVGEGRPFVAQIEPALEKYLRDEWKEYGTKTGKPRDLGWADAVALRYAVEVGSVDALAGTCGDRLETLAKIGQKVKLVVAYEIAGKKYDQWDLSFHRRDTLYKAKPVFEEFDPWEKFVEPSGEKLTPHAQRYVDRIQELVGKEFMMLGTGPEQDEMLVYQDPFASK
ncbi:MAG: adenylosuccinate synthetase [Nanoarchaeota archaeon]|nr:adenylosuccinate synthetase [Nanoarchaeota archaeon]